MPGTSPAMSQFDWLISMTAISVLSWSKAARDRLRSFDCGMGHSIGLLDSAEGDMPSPLAPYHIHNHFQSLRHAPNFSLHTPTSPSLETLSPWEAMRRSHGGAPPRP